MSDQREVDKLIIENYGAKNLSKVKRNTRNGSVESRRRFAEKYPGADFTKFEYQVELDTNGDINKYVVYYKVDDVSSYDITSSTFLNNRKWVWYLYQWERIWSSHGTVRDFKYIPNSFPYKINKFDIYVTDSTFFTSDFPELNTSWNDGENSGEDVAVNALKFDYENNPYFASVLAMYLATYSCGISIEHLKSSPNTPKIVTSLARYHIYYHISRFLRDPTKMTKYVSSEMLRKLSRSLQHDKVLLYDNLFQFSGSAPNISLWYYSQPKSKRDKIVGYRYARNSGGRIAGIQYQLVGGNTKNVYRRGSEDFLEFAAHTSNGLTRVGQLLFQQSVESYVYCVLGAQARTRWPIVGRGAMSLQTQSVFIKLVSNTVVQDDHTVAVTNMRKAIKDTNVILNMAISPGIILIPSNMIIQTEMVSGYNNILTLASRGMEFGVNSAVNYLKSDTEGGTEGDTETATPAAGKGTTTDSTSKRTPIYKDTVANNPTDVYKEYLYLLITTVVGGVLISKYVI